MSTPSICAIIVAGGTGSRMGMNFPKQFIEINGKEIIEHTVDAFIKSCCVDKIVIVCHKDYIAHTTALFENREFPIVIAEGADTRQKSVVNGLSKADDCRYVMIHDAVRCCINPDDIRTARDALFIHKACALGVRVKDTIKKSDKNGKIIETVDRNNLWQIQTPQCFESELINKAHKMAADAGIEATDDCQVAEFAGYDVIIVEGSYENIKITTPSDLALASDFLKGAFQ